VRDRDRENAIRKTLSSDAFQGDAPDHDGNWTDEDVQVLLEEIDYLRGQYETLRAHASELRRRAEGPVEFKPVA